MDYFAIEMLVLFFAGLFRRTATPRVIVLRWFALAHIVGGATCFIVALFVGEQADHRLLIAGVIFLAVFFVLACRCAFLVDREKAKHD